MSYTGHTVKSVRDFDKPNYNLGSKDMGKALINASLEQQGGVKNNTHLSRLPALRQFAQYLKEETSVRRLNHITKAHVMRYGEHLKEKVDEHEGLSNTSARNYLSHVNRALAQARGDNKLIVCAKSDLSFTPISGIARKDGSMTRQQHDKLLANADSPVSLVAKLGRHWGMRFREAALFDARKALKELESKASITISRGTKGGQSRNVPFVLPAQLETLRAVASYQEKVDHDSLVPKELSFKQFQSHAWRVANRIDEHYRSHGERKHFACEAYFRYMGCHCPVRAGVKHGSKHMAYIARELGISEREAAIRDKQARYQVSELLGHHRINITNAYLG